MGSTRARQWTYESLLAAVLWILFVVRKLTCVVLNFVVQFFILLETAMGVSIGAQSGNVEYSGPLEIVQNLIMTRTLNPLHQSDLVYAFTPQGRKYKANLKIIHRFIDQVIANRRDEMESLIREKKVNVHQLASDDLGVITEKKRYAFLDSLLVTHFQNKANFTEKNIKDEVNTFMFEG